MPIEPARRRYNDLVNTVGRATIHALFPTDIEVYLMALELTTSAGDTIDYFVFPIMPNQISKTEPTRTTIRKTSGGTTVYTNAAYIPQDINIRGNFGRHFRIFFSPRTVPAGGLAWSTNAGIFDLSQAETRGRLSFRTPIFNAGVKTGYGATRILKAIVNKANGVDNSGQPFRLFFYNLALGESHLVTVPPNGLTLTQSLDKNMIWEYSLNLTTLAPIQALRDRGGGSSLLRLLSIGTIQQGINTVANDLTGIIG